MTMTALDAFLSTSIQNLQSHVRDIQDQANRIREVDAIVAILDQPIQILRQSGELVDLSAQPGLLRQVADLLLYLIENYGGFLYTRHPQGWKTIQKEWHGLNAQVESFRRKVDLIWPPTDQDLIGAIKWLTENGSEVDLAILEIARQNLSRTDEETRDLLEYCRQRINGHSEKTASTPGQGAIQISDLLADKPAPTTYLIHSWGTPAAIKFFEVIHAPTVERHNASYCLLKTSSADPFPEIQETPHCVFLDLDKKEDAFFYHHTKRDLIFFPASKKNELSLLARWQNRARVVVLDGTGYFSQQLLRLGKELGLQVYIWDGAATVKT